MVVIKKDEVQSDSFVKVVTIQVIIPRTKWDLLLMADYDEEDIAHSLSWGAKQEFRSMVGKLEEALEGDIIEDEDFCGSA